MSWKKLCLLGVVALASCGGDDNDNNNSTPPEDQVLTGTLLDAPVINIDYRTDTQEGVTNAQGEFNYLEGERVFFSIGDLNLPSAAGDEVVTPMDMVGFQDSEDFRVVNIIRLLQSLDDDGNPDNGITITETAKNSATQVNFGLLQEDFEASAAVLNLIVNAGQLPVVTELVPAAQAIAHFESELVAAGIPFGTVAEQNQAQILAYLEENNLQATRHSSGLYYQIDEPGSGGFPDANATVRVNYRGFLLDGTVFDQSGNDPSSFSLSGLIEGWQIGIPLLQRGGSGTFYLPADLGYGASGTAGIPANSVIVFEIELVDF